MNGDLDADRTPDEDQHMRFLDNARELLRRSAEPADARSPDLDVYMDRLFTDSLRRCIADAEEQQRLLTLQPVVFARLAGFLAAHGDPYEDPLRQAIEALLHGYSESERLDDTGPEA